MRMCIALLLLLATGQVFAQDAETPLKAAIQEARVLAATHRAEANVPGLAVGVSVGGEIVWEEGFGLADVEKAVAVTPDTKFRIGSVSKPLTAAAVAQLVSEGRLDLDAPVQQYVPTFPEKRWTVTTRMLGAHLAGIRHYRGNEMLSSARYATVAEGLEIFAADSLDREPGTRYSYSSYGWNLISAVIEGAAGIPYLQYMEQTVFDPLEMDETAADWTDRLIPERVAFYDRNDSGEWINAPYVDNSYKWAGGGFLSTTEDLLLFANAHMSGDFLDATEREVLFTEQHTVDGEGVGYGFGWSLSDSDPQGEWIGHTGGSVGGITRLVMDPSRNIAVVTFMNISSANNSLGLDILSVFRTAYDAGQ